MNEYPFDPHRTIARLRAGLHHAFVTELAIEVPGSDHGDPEAATAAAAWYPLVGLVLGLTRWAAWVQAGWLWGPLGRAMGALGAALGVTGGRPWWQLCETVAGRRSDDSAPGVQTVTIGFLLPAVMAVVLHLVLLVGVVGRLRLAALILVPVIGRWCQSLCLVAFPSEPAVDAAGEPVASATAGWLEWTIATITCSALSLLLVPRLGALLIPATAAVAVSLVGEAIRSRRGHVDTAARGALVVLAELVALAAIRLLG